MEVRGGAWRKGGDRQREGETKYKNKHIYMYTPMPLNNI